MAYLGRPGATAPLTSADIPDDSITAAKIVDGAIDFQDEIGFLENKATTQNLSGTYSTERMYLNDSYTLTGDVTVTGHLALGTVADADVVITQDSTERTITGSGTLESGELLSSKETDLTGMTGVLSSGVTGGSGLDAIVYPVGHILQVRENEETSGGSTTTDTGANCVAHTITLSSTSNKIWVHANCYARATKSGSKHNALFGFRMVMTGHGSTETISYGPRDSNGFYGIRLDTVNEEINHFGGYFPFSHLFAPASVAEITIQVSVACMPSTNTTVYSHNSDSGAVSRSNIVLMEVVA